MSREGCTVCSPHFVQSNPHLQNQKRGFVISLCDHSGNMVKPWAEAGYECWCVDIRHERSWADFSLPGVIRYIKGDVKTFNLLVPETKIIFAFPPCTNLAISGARWFAEKGLRGLINGLDLVEYCRDYAESTGKPWMLENPVSTISSYWRKPDYHFHPYEYADYEGGEDDTYTKKTCLWTGNGFVMPPKKPRAITDNRIHTMAPSEERGNLRSITPMGFARAVFEANHEAS